MSEEDLKLVHRVPFDTVSPHRAAVLRALLNGERLETARLPRTTLRRSVEDLALVGLLTEGGEFTSEVRRLFGIGGF